MRIDRASKVIAAPRQRVFDALINREAIAKWLPPSGARGVVEKFDPTPGGAFRMMLVFEGASETKRKTTENSDVVDGEFVDLVPPEQIDQRFTFVSDDPQFAGTMLMRWRLTEEGGGTRVSVSAKNVPAGISPEEHQAGMSSSLANLARYVEGGTN